MQKKPAFNQKTLMYLAIAVVAAIFLGLNYLNKDGGGPIAGMVLGDTPMTSIDAYTAAADTHGDGIYLVVGNENDQYQADYEVDVPADGDLYATVYFTDIAQGDAFTGRWVRDDAAIADEVGILESAPEGLIAYKLDGTDALGGDYTFELYQNDTIVFAYPFVVGTL